MGALNFGGAMEQLVQSSSLVEELTTPDQMVSSSKADVPCFLGIGVL